MQSSISTRQSLRRPTLATTCFGLFTLFLLAGYALLDRGFAYLGLPPYAYVGEFGLLLGLLTLGTVLHVRLWQSSVTWLLLAFMLWGLARTLPYISTYGIDSLRDAVIWAYAVYALAVATAVLRLNAFEGIIELYSRALPIFLILAPILFALHAFADDLIPRWPWGPQDVSIINPKPGDLATHYAGAFTFIVSGLSATTFDTLWFALWVVGAVPLITYSRASLVTIASAVGLVMLLRPTLKSYYTLAVAGMCLLLVLLVISAGNVGLTIQGRRSVSAEQMLENVESIFSNDVRPDLDLEGTKRWRELWWNKIVDYTVYGQYFWTGKGFGVNLADDDGFTLGDDHTLRSPHSGHMTILARMGVPGLALWVILQLLFSLKLFMNFWRDRLFNKRLSALELWVLLYWLSFIINGSFDVFLEGPQGGIWFWSVFGFGLSLIVGHRRLTQESAVARRSGSPNLST